MPLNVCMAAIEGKMNAQADEQRHMALMQRWQAWVSLLPHVKKGSVRKPEDLMRFSWERSKVIKVQMTEADRKRKIEKLKKIL